MDEKQSLVDRVKAWQAEMNLTNLEVATMCGCSERTYERFRQGVCDNMVLHTLLSLLCGSDTTESLLKRTGRGFTINLEEYDEF